MNLKDTYNKIARDWHTDHLEDNWWVTGTEKFISYLPPGAKVLDVGCGGGVKSQYLLQRNLDVTGFDFSEEFIQIAREHAPRAKFYVLDLYEAPNVLKQEFDAIFAQAVFLHVPRKDIQEIILSYTKILKKGGYFYMALKDREGHTKDEEIVKENDYGYEYERFFSYYSIDEIENVLKKSGFEIVEKSFWGKLLSKSRWMEIIGRKI